MGGKSFADVIVEGRSLNEQKSLMFSSKLEVRDRLQKSFIGEVAQPGESYNIQSHFEMEGVF